jgi:hypothetical protein
VARGHARIPGDTAPAPGTSLTCPYTRHQISCGTRVGGWVLMSGRGVPPEKMQVLLGFLAAGMNPLRASQAAGVSRSFAYGLDRRVNGVPRLAARREAGGGRREAAARSAQRAARPGQRVAPGRGGGFRAGAGMIQVAAR